MPEDVHDIVSVSIMHIWETEVPQHSRSHAYMRETVVGLYTKATIITISLGNSYFLPASINEWRIDQLVNTGSAFSILRKDVWDRLISQDKI